MHPLRTFATRVVFPLYRSYLREVKLLPHHYLRQFFRFKAANDARAVLDTKKPLLASLRDRKVRRMKKELRRIQRGNEGFASAFEHLLDLAYGRKGRLRRELMEPLTNDPDVIKPLIPGVAKGPPIIPGVERSRPATFTDPTAALATSAHSRDNESSLKATSLITPHDMPARADPNSIEAKYLGSFSKRRRKNILHRHYVRQVKRILPPLELSIPEDTAHRPFPQFTSGLQEHGPIQSLEKMVGLPTPSRNLTRRERQAGVIAPDVGKRHPNRWLRRRYQHLLAKIPVLVYKPQGMKYVVETQPRAVLRASGGQREPNRLAYLRPEDAEWLAKSGTSQSESEASRRLRLGRLKVP